MISRVVRRRTRIRALTGWLLLTGLTLLAATCGGSDNSPAPDMAVADGTAASSSSDIASQSPTESKVDSEPAAEPTEPTPTAAPPAPATVEPEPAPAVGSFDDVDAFAAEFLVDSGLDGAGLIVVHRDEGVIHHAHYGTFSEDRISMIASTSKIISSGVLMKLHQDGLFDIDAPLGDSVDWALDQPEMTAAQLVSNSSGLVGLFPDILYMPYICQWLAGQTIGDCAEQVLTTGSDDGDVVEPDTEFRYGGAQWQVAGAIAEAVAGKSWDKLIDETYREPCGTESLGYLNLGQVDAAAGYPVDFAGDPSGFEPSQNPTIEGGAHITTADYGTLLLMHLRGGACPNAQVFTQESLDAMHTDRIGDAYAGTTDADGGGYGLGWWVDHETGVISDGGAWGANSWLHLDEGYGAYWVIEDSFETTAGIIDSLYPLVHQAITGEDL